MTAQGRRRVRRVQKASFSLEDLFRGATRQADMFDLADILMVPIVNVDGYINLGSRFGKRDWDTAKLTRKNSNNEIPCE